MDVEKLSVDGFNLNVADAKARDMISDKYDPDNGTYVVGDTCINDDILYICNTDIDTPEDFDSSKWDADTVGHYCSELKSNLTDLDNAMEKTIKYGTTENKGFVVTVNHTMVTFRGFFYSASAVSAWTWLFDLSDLPTKYKPKAYSSDIGISTSQANVRLRMTTSLYIENTAQLNGGSYSITVMWQMRGE